MAKEKRLIDANALCEGLVENHPVVIYARNAPTVDALEVVHGRWENVQETEMYVPDMKLTITKTAETCSECKARIGFVGAKQYLFDTFCPNCGARMDVKQ